MNELSRDVTSVALAIVGVATLAVLFVKSNQTANIISSASGGFANVLSVAMGGNSTGYNAGHFGGY